MATTTINTSSIGTGVRFDPGAGNSGLVLADAVLVSTDSVAVNLKNGQYLTVYGLVYGETNGIQTDTTGSGRILVAASGRITGGVNGILSSADFAGVSTVTSLINNGEITAIADDGVDAVGDDFSLVNNGAISGQYGIYFADIGANTVQIVNTGVISATSVLGFGVRLYVNSGGVLQNSGTIINGVEAQGQSEGIRIVNTGTIGADRSIQSGQAVVFYGSQGDTIRNAGTIAGVVSTGLGADRVQNTGSILGDILLEGGDDLYRAGTGGTVDGRVQGGDGNDTLLGGREDDDLDGGADDDFLRGAAGDDTLAGGGGNDVLEFGSGDDTYLAGDSDGNDDLDGGDGIDTYDARNVSASVTIRLHEQRATGTGIGNDSVQFFENASGGSGADSLVGDAARNVLRGNGGADNINGLEGNDRIVGGAGNDVIIGNTGRDVLTGGADADTFDFNSTADSAVGDSVRDLVTDFTQMVDLIDLSTIDASTVAGGNQAFSFIGSGAFTSVAGQLRFINFGGTNYTVVEGDVNGDAKADFQIGFIGSIVFQVGDFIL